MGTLSRIGFVGLGAMGYPMAARLMACGFPVAVYDVDRPAMERFVDAYGGVLAASAAELGPRSDVVITMLPDGNAVEAVVLGCGAPLGGAIGDTMADGSVLIDMSSSAPIGTRALGRALAQRGIAMLDAPVSGGVKRAAEGTLTIMVGGEPEVVRSCRPVLTAIGERIFETGPLGSGHASKALNNLVSAAGLLVTAEALLIGRRFGLDPAVMIDVFNGSTARNNSTENKFHQFILSRTFASGFSLGLMVKDLRIAIDLAQATDTPAPFSSACRDLWRAALADLGATVDHTAIVRWLEATAQATPAEQGFP